MARKKEPAKINPRIDTAWFENQIRDAKLSGRRVARMMNMHSSSFNRLVNGRQQWRPQEIIDFAQIIAQPREEVTARTGATLPPDDSDDGVTITATAGSHGVISGSVSGSRRVALPKAARGLEGVRVLNGPFNGWVALYTPAVRGIEPEAVGRLAVAWRGKERLLGVLQRGADRGYWDVTALGGFKHAGVKVDKAAPVLWVRC